MERSRDERDRQLLRIAQRITIMGNNLSETLGCSRMDWLDDTADMLTNMVYDDLNIPAWSLDDATGNTVVAYLDNRIDLDSVWDQLRDLSDSLDGDRSTLKEGE